MMWRPIETAPRYGRWVLILLLVFALELPASAQRPAEVVVLGPGGEIVITGDWVGAELGETMKVVVDQNEVFLDGFED